MPAADSRESLSWLILWAERAAPPFDSGRVLGSGPRSRAHFINETPPPRRHAVVRPLPAAARVEAVEARGRECQLWLEKQRGKAAQLVPGLGQ